MKAPPKVFQELEEYDEIQCETCAPLDASKINYDDNDDEQYARMDVDDVICDE